MNVKSLAILIAVLLLVVLAAPILRMQVVEYRDAQAGAEGEGQEDAYEPPPPWTTARLSGTTWRLKRSEDLPPEVGGGTVNIEQYWHLNEGGRLKVDTEAEYSNVHPAAEQVLRETFDHNLGTWSLRGDMVFIKQQLRNQQSYEEMTVELHISGDQMLGKQPGMYGGYVELSWMQ